MSRKPPEMITRKVPNHPCFLELTHKEDFLTDFISGGYLVNLRRKFRRLLVVSETNPESKVFLRSTAQIQEERSRHLKHHYFMIHPLSEFRVLWENTMILVYLLLLSIMIPLELAFLIRTPLIILVPKFVLDICCYVDVIINCFTGFFEDQDQKIRLSLKSVTGRYIFGKYYINGYFLPDVLSSLPITLCIYLTHKHHLAHWKAIFLLKLLRIPTMFTYIHKYCIRRKVWSYNLRPVFISIWFIIGMSSSSGITIFIMTIITNQKMMSDSLEDVRRSILYLIDICTKILESAMLVGPDNMLINTPWQYKLLPICYILMGAVINMVILAQILRFYTSRNTSRNKHQKLLQEISQYMTYRQMPAELKEKIVRYVDFKYQRRILKEAEIMSTLSKNLRQEIMIHNCQVMVERVDFFKNLPPSLLIKLVSKLRSDVYLKNEFVFRIGHAANAMYFIYVGVVTIRGQYGSEIMHLGEGKHFGEVSLMNNTPRMYEVLARSDCELLRLNRKDITEVLQPYPHLCAQLTSLGLEKQRKWESMLNRMSVVSNY